MTWYLQVTLALYTLGLMHSILGFYQKRQIFVYVALGMVVCGFLSHTVFLVTLGLERHGHPPGRAFLKIQVVNIERNPKQIPYDFNYSNFVNDPGNLLCGSMTFHIVTSRIGADNKSFIQLGGAHLNCQPSYSGTE